MAAAIVIQVQSSAKDDQYAALRRDDLVQLLDGLTTETDQLTAEVAELERTRDALASGADAEAVAAQEAQKRADTLKGILAGTVAAVGPRADHHLGAAGSAYHRYHAGSHPGAPRCFGRRGD